MNDLTEEEVQHMMKACCERRSIRLGVDITSCMTGATYSKKKFWLKYYDAEVNPICMLPPHMDEFVRASYCGGRVECYALGNTIACLTGNRLYYFDVTSLFPSSCITT